MNLAPHHARRRRRLLVLICALFIVAAWSPRLRSDFTPEPEPSNGIPLNGPRVAVHLAPPAGGENVLPDIWPTDDATDLFAYLPTPADAAAIADRIPAPAQKIHYVALNAGLVEGKNSVFWQRHGGRLQVPLPDGRNLAVEITHTEALGADRFTSHGRVLDEPGGRAVFAYFGGRIAARFESIKGGAFELRPVANENGEVANQFYEIDPSLIPDCGGHPEPAADPGIMMRLAEAAALAHGANDTTTAADTYDLGDDTVTVDLLMAYTRAVRTSFGSAALVQVQLDLGVARVNRDFEASSVNARLRLAGALEVNYPGDDLPASQAGWQSNALSRLRGQDDGFMDEIHARRDEVGADLVTLLVRRPDPESSGIAYLLDQPRDYVGPYLGFSVVNASFMGSPVLSHEIAHNFGAAHARGDPGASGAEGGAYPYSFGYRFNSFDAAGRATQLRTIMAYSPGSRVGYFSNPRLRLPTAADAATEASPTASGPALGVPEGQPGAADNARTLQQNAFQVASFRPTATPGYAGRLLNVSTRAWVGAGDRRMIGGFVLAGTGPREVLIRAVGPALAPPPINVPGTLADPTLQVIDNATGRPVAANDNWSLAPDAGFAAVEAARRAGAFPLPNGSADAALVATLAPGSYTAVVGGKTAEGVALVEAYGVTPGASRQINLSTRAYGSAAQPIVAGFVVGAEGIPPGGTKRLLLRVLGPSLTTYGLAADQVMSDPLLQLFDRSGTLILENDDWDSPTTTLGLHLPTIRRGVVDQLSEQAVFDALQRLGASPMHPVEPGIIVDLRPGSYTLSVTPFELLPRQPAEPGLALVEVYELPSK